MAKTPKSPTPPRTPRTPRTAGESSTSEQAFSRQQGTPDFIDPGQIVPIPTDINRGLSSAKNMTMLQILGMPRDHVDEKCRIVTNEPLRSLIETQNVGPFRVTGLKPAVTSLKDVLMEVQKAHPEVHASLGTAGMLCVRFIANSTKLSNHSWGCAIDISINGALDGLKSGPTGRRDGMTLAGLAAMAPFFNRAGWFWGVGFSSFEDGMHFEVADETIRQWHMQGLLGDSVSARTTTSSNLSFGDRGSEVLALQQALAKHGFDILPDGKFGPITHGLVIDFQAAHSLVANGIVDAATKAALGLG